MDNVITALNSNTMIAPNYWVDHKTGNDYFLTVQYYENGRPAIHNFVDLKQIPLRARPNARSTADTTLDSPTLVKRCKRRIRADAHRSRPLPDSARGRRLRHSVR